jgi:RNA polymerase sigma factor (TIGR02999 family)
MSMFTNPGEPEELEQSLLTVLLNRMRQGDRGAGEQATALVYKELHEIASRQLRRERHGHTLQTTALVHEAYLRLAGGGTLELHNRVHFFAVASKQMRRILIDHARSTSAQKRGGGAAKIDLDKVQVGAEGRSVDVLLLNQALEELERVEPRAARVVELRYFGGYTDQEAADVLGVSFATARRDWEFARAWLFDKIHGRP